jgi:NTE family protein
MRGARVLDSLRDDFGLNPGKRFHQWLKQELELKGIDSWEKLGLLRQKGNEHLLQREGMQPFLHKHIGRLAFVAADITTQTKVVFPEMADLYWSDPLKVNPADFVRASMSVPFFFQPFRVTNLPYGAEQLQKWREIGYTGNVPDEVFFIDGGINSNFPIDLFHNHGSVPKAPTFGVKLGVDRHKPKIFRKLPSLVNAIFESVRQVHDFDFIARNPDYKRLVHCIDTEGFNWLNFSLTDEEKLRLFEAGVRGAAAFLRQFDWAKYKKLREALSEVKSLSESMKTNLADEHAHTIISGAS